MMIDTNSILLYHLEENIFCFESGFFMYNINFSEISTMNHCREIRR